MESLIQYYYLLSSTVDLFKDGRHFREQSRHGAVTTLASTHHSGTNVTARPSAYN